MEPGQVVEVTVCFTARGTWQTQLCLLVHTALVQFTYFVHTLMNNYLCKCLADPAVARVCSIVNFGKIYLNKFSASREREGGNVVEFAPLPELASRET